MLTLNVSEIDSKAFFEGPLGITLVDLASGNTLWANLPELHHLVDLVSLGHNLALALSDTCYSDIRSLDILVEPLALARNSPCYSDHRQVLLDLMP